MNISAELSLYPLTEAYPEIIKSYIAALHKHDSLEVRTHALSTEVFGDYATVMQAVSLATRTVFEQDSGAVLVAKFANSDRRDN